MGIEAGEVVLTTERVVVRRLRADDADRLAEYRSDPEVAALQGWEAPYSIESASALIDEVAGHRLGAPGWVQLGIEVDGELVGDMGLRGIDDDHVELGITLARPQWGKGYATEAGGAIVEHLLGPLGFATAVAEVHPDNQASLALMHRLGFGLNAMLDDGFIQLTRSR